MSALLRLFGCAACLGLGIGIFRVDAHGAAWEQSDGYRSRAVEALPANLPPGFTEIPAARSGLAFTNSIAEPSLARNYNLMLGSGVAAGDFDGDGACDLFFCSIAGANALYRNLGGWRFEDVTARAGVALPGRTNTGAAFADMNGDGRLDLLVSSLGRGVALLLNKGDGTFREATSDAGLATNTGALTLALADVDGDGDLDLYVCNYGAQALSRGGGEFFVKTIEGKTVIRGPGAERMRVIAGRLVELGEPDVLYLNDGGARFRQVPWNSTPSSTKTAGRCPHPGTSVFPRSSVM